VKKPMTPAGVRRFRRRAKINERNRTSKNLNIALRSGKLPKREKCRCDELGQIAAFTDLGVVDPSKVFIYNGSGSE